MSEIKLRYRLGGKLFEVSGSDDNVEIADIDTGTGRSVTVTARRDVELCAASTMLERRLKPDDTVMANGYQSWTKTTEFRRREGRNDLSRLPAVIEDRFHFKAYGSQFFGPENKDLLLGFDYSYVRGREPLFIGSFNHANAYLIISFDRSSGEIELRSDVEGRAVAGGESFRIFDYMIAGDGKAYFDHYTPRSTKKLFGYTSWYNHYQNISEDLVFAALDKADERFDLFQIDDGFETFVGDWLSIDPKKFPNGLEPVVERIHSKGMMAGIWLAPFVAENKSALMTEHPDWIARDENGGAIYAGCNWSGDAALDLNNAEVTAYVRKVLRHYVDLGFDFFKLDFIYASGLKPLKGKTRSETAEFAYGLIEEELKDKLILGCGATLSNCFGRFDYCRIGPDVSLKFDDSFYMRAFHPERISTKVTLQNTIFRSDLDGHMFLIDPDVFLLRDDNIKMAPAQREALTKINALFGSLLMTSDDIGSYDEGKKKILDEALRLFCEAKVLGRRREGDTIKFSYEFDGGRHDMRYDIKLGTLKEE